jgi:hypothetical protein
MSDTLDIREVARVLGGDALRGNRALVPGPGHSRRDRSLSIRLAPDAPDGFMVHSHAGDDWRACRDYVKAALGIDSGGAASPRLVASPEPDDRERIAQASAIWMGAVEPQGTPVEAYLASRGLSLPSAVRWHPSCPFGKSTRTGCMVALVVDIETNEPRAIHRTSITTDGRKVEVGGYDRLSLGPIMGGAIKLSPGETVTAAVGIGEGIESTLSLNRIPDLAALPVWSLLTANGVRAFPVLSGIETVFVAVDMDEAGISAAEDLGERWYWSGRDVVLIEPRKPGQDLNDVVRAYAA